MRLGYRGSAAVQHLNPGRRKEYTWLRSEITQYKAANEVHRGSLSDHIELQIWNLTHGCFRVCWTGTEEGDRQAHREQHSKNQPGTSLHTDRPSRTAIEHPLSQVCVRRF